MADRAMRVYRRKVRTRAALAIIAGVGQENLCDETLFHNGALRGLHGSPAHRRGKHAGSARIRLTIERRSGRTPGLRASRESMRWKCGPGIPAAVFGCGPNRLSCKNAFAAGVRPHRLGAALRRSKMCQAAGAVTAFNVNAGRKMLCPP